MFDWAEFLELAEDLLATRPNDEAAARSAISRAYSTVFHAGRSYLEAIDLPIDTSGGAHRHVRYALEASAPRLSQELLRLHEWRKQADYDDPSSFKVEHQARMRSS